MNAVNPLVGKNATGTMAAMAIAGMNCLGGDRMPLLALLGATEVAIFHW